jgi:hypothetical protein
VDGLDQPALILVRNVPSMSIQYLVNVWSGVDVDIFTCLDHFKAIIVLDKTRFHQQVHSLAQCSAEAP